MHRSKFGPNDRLRYLHHNGSVAVTEFILFISEHLSNRIVSDRSRAHAGLVCSTRQPTLLHCAVHSTCNSLPERGCSTLFRVKTKQHNKLLVVALDALINVSKNGPDRTVARKSSRDEFSVCAGAFRLCATGL